MTTLEFKTKGGTRKFSDLTAHTHTQAHGTYLMNPAALMEELEAAPEKQIRVTTRHDRHNSLVIDRAAEECGQALQAQMMAMVISGILAAAPTPRTPGQQGGPEFLQMALSEQTHRGIARNERSLIP